MANRRISEKPFDVSLPNRGKGAQQHRGNGNKGNNLLPLRFNAGEGLFDDPHKQRDGSDLGTGRKESRDRRRRTFINIRRPHMKWYGRDLERKPREDEH